METAEVEKNEVELLFRQGPHFERVMRPRPGEWGRAPAIVLTNPKYPHNVGAVIRAASCFRIGQVWYTGNRVSMDNRAQMKKARASAIGHFRLPREERMRGYADVRLFQNDRPLDQFERGDAVPVCVEFDGTESLYDFEHPENVVYVFGPEDGSVGPDFTRLCHRFVRIPTKHCLNLSVAVAMVLYDRALKQHAMDSTGASK